jgi:hypothetical protein
MKNVFALTDALEIITRINKLNPSSTPVWGKMQVAQMLAHCNVTYELVYENIHPKPNLVMKFIIKLLAKGSVISENPYKRNLRTAPAFIIKTDKIFEVEKDRLINYISKTQQLGEAYFDGKESHSFGFLSTNEWNNMFYKHLDHHLTQFGV